MTKFLIVYKGGSAPEGEAAQKASMDAWTAWFKELGDAVVDMGNPLGEGKSINKDGDISAQGELNGYSIIQVDSLDSAVKAGKMCPVLESGGSIEVYEVVPVM